MTIEIFRPLKPCLFRNIDFEIPPNSGPLSCVFTSTCAIAGLNQHNQSSHAVKMTPESTPDLLTVSETGTQYPVQVYSNGNSTRDEDEDDYDDEVTNGSRGTQFSSKTIQFSFPTSCKRCQNCLHRSPKRFRKPCDPRVPRILSILSSPFRMGCKAFKPHMSWQALTVPQFTLNGPHGSEAPSDQQSMWAHVT